MELDVLKTKLEPFKIKIGFMKKGLYTQVCNFLPDECNIVYAIEGIDGANKVPVIVTDDNLYIAQRSGPIGINMETIDREAITGTSMSGGMIASITFKTPGQNYTIKQLAIPYAKELSKLMAK